MNVLLGVSGGIACYKSCALASELTKRGAEVNVVMTENAAKFVAPLTFAALTRRRVYKGMFEDGADEEIAHITLAKAADIFVVAPATANVIAKLAAGIADDLLTSAALAARCPLVICPAMNTNMYENPATQANLALLKARGFVVCEPNTGRLACGDSGRGRMAEPSQIVAFIDGILSLSRELCGKRFLVTAGGTTENIDGVRFITNRSSGKMGCAIVRELKRRGAEVVLVAGAMSVDPPYGTDKVVRVQSAKEMFDACMSEYEGCDCIVKAAAVGDYAPENVYDNKIKGEKVTLRLKKNPDIAAALGKVKGERKLVIFCAETQELLSSAAKKLADKGADMVVANDVSQPGIGFGSDNNAVTVIRRDGHSAEYPSASKDKIAKEVVDEITSLWSQA